METEEGRETEMEEETPGGSARWGTSQEPRGGSRIGDADEGITGLRAFGGGWAWMTGGQGEH